MYLKLPPKIRTSQDGIQKIVQHENFKPHVYLDTAKRPTIGYGHLIKPGESFPNGISEARARELFRQDMHTAENAVRNHVRTNLTQPQFDALTSFVFNVGADKFANSTLLQKLNEGNHEGAAGQFSRWIYTHVNGKPTVDPGLINRRRAEEDLFRSGLPGK